MLAMLRPDLRVNNIKEIPLQVLNIQGIQGIIIDLDNTLTSWNSTMLAEGVHEWLDKLTSLGFKVCIVSNSNPARISAILNNLKIPFIPYALKPRKKAFLEAMDIMKTAPSTTAVIGDQVFTDILGGKRVKTAITILVPPLSTREFLGTKLMRMLEKVVISRF